MGTADVIEAPMDVLQEMVEEAVVDHADIDIATDRVIGLLEADRSLRDALSERLIYQAVRRRVWSVRGQRRQAAKYERSEAGDRAVAEAINEVIEVLDSYTVEDKPLRYATREMLERSADTHLRQARGHDRAAMFEEAVAADLNEDQIVEEAWSETEIRALRNRIFQNGD